MGRLSIPETYFGTVVVNLCSDVCEASRFLSALAGTGRITFQTFDDTAAKKKQLSKILHGSMDQHDAKLRQLNRQGAGVFAMVNHGDGKGRRKENVQSVRALFVDLDGAPLEPVMRAPIQPQITVESSPGRFHAYWLVNDVPLADFTHFQSHLAQMFDADPAVKDLPRVMRLPGFYHHKDGAQLSRLLMLQDGPRINRAAFIEAFGINHVIPVGERNARVFDAASGFKRAGIPKRVAQARIAKINATACAVPLHTDEVNAVVDQAYGYAVQTFSMIPHEVIDSLEFEILSGSAVKLLAYALRRHRPGKDFALPHSEFAHIPDMKNRKRFRAAVEELIGAGFLKMIRNYISGVVSESRMCGLYAITDRVQNVPKQKHG